MSTQKTITFYECDICKKDYDTQAEATACEASHGTIAISRCEYGLGTANAGVFPEALIITNGTKQAQYVFFKEIRTNG